MLCSFSAGEICTEIATANTVLIVYLELGACAHARYADINNPPSSQFEGFLSPNASAAAVSCSAPALNATTTSSLTLTKAWLAIAIHKQACQMTPPPPKLAAFHKQFQRVITQLGVYWEMAASEVSRVISTQRVKMSQMINK